MKRLSIQRQKNENHEIHIIPFKNQENHANLMNPQQNHKNNENIYLNSTPESQKKYIHN